MPILDLYCDQILWYLFFKYLWYRLEQGLSGGKQKILISKNTVDNIRKHCWLALFASETFGNEYMSNY